MPTSEFGPDGTQAPPPPRLFPDALAGLVTADTVVAPQWTSGYPTSRVSVPTPPAPTEEMRQAIFSQLEEERRRPRGRAQRPVHHQAPQQFVPGYQMPVGQQHQPAKQTGGVATFIGCLVVLGFFVLVAINILAAIFS